mmetsp:Transcript_12449/g.46041  ORF Transcript_12449/g.46041 Transcript_12449/m.46041 type:complete len:212 (+) Transcript_12449:907-1542(+)
MALILRGMNALRHPPEDDCARAQDDDHDHRDAHAVSQPLRAGGATATHRPLEPGHHRNEEDQGQQNAEADSRRHGDNLKEPARAPGAPEPAAAELFMPVPNALVEHIRRRAGQQGRRHGERQTAEHEATVREHPGQGADEHCKPARQREKEPEAETQAELLGHPDSHAGGKAQPKDDAHRAGWMIEAVQDAEVHQRDPQRPRHQVKVGQIR